MAFLEAEQKQTLLDRYFDIEWRDDVSDLRCVRCHRVAISHCVSSCQHIFCRTCSKFYNEEEQLKCPQCHESIAQPDVKDFDVEVKIHQLKIYCPNKKYGCKHAVELRKMPSHLLTCMATREVELRGKVQVKIMSPDDNIGKLKERMKEVNNVVEKKLNELETKTDNVEKKFNRFDRKINGNIKALTAEMTNVDKKVEGMESASKKSRKQSQSIKSLLQSIDERVEKIESLHQQTKSEMEEIWVNLFSVCKRINSLHYKVIMMKYPGLETEEEQT